jgi:hypothetical protein
MSKRLKLKAETADDLTILSSALQDAIVRVGEIKYDSKSRAVTLRLSRFTHEKEIPQRVLCGLRFDGILSVSARGIDRADPEAFAVLIALHHEEGETVPECDVVLIFAGGGEIKLKAECIDVILADVSEPRTTAVRPLHPES